MKNMLFRNSFYLILSTGILGIFGFVFWIICSRLFGSYDIGIATAFISAASLVSGFSMLGFNNSLIRFLSASDKKNAYISTSFIITIIASIAAAGVFIVWAIAAKSPIMQSSASLWWILLFVLYVCFLTINEIIESIFIAYRAAVYIVFKNIFFSTVKVVLPLLLVGVGAFAIIGSLAMALVVSLVFGLVLLGTKFVYRPLFRVDTKIIGRIYVFAAGNYMGSIFGMLPSTLVPLIILSRLGAQDAAFFYMPLMIISFLNIIPSASAQSFFAEVSHDEKGLRAHLLASLKYLFLLMLPAAAVVMIAGPWVLGFFGPLYAEEGTMPLLILVLASLVGALNYFGDTLLNIQKLSRLYIFMNGLNASIIIALVYINAPLGLTAVALSNLAGQILTLGVYLILNWQLIKEHISASAPLTNPSKVLEMP